MKKLLVILLVLGMAAPVMAAEWNFYGSARAGFFYSTVDDKASNAQDENGEYESDTDLNYYVHGNSRIGANVKTSDQISGRFEYGAGPNLRLLYGDFNFGSGTLRLGQDYTIVDTLYSNQAVDTDNGLNYEGLAYEGRIGQLKLMMGGFEAALITPTVGTSGTGEDRDVLIPKIELGYTMKMDTMSFGGYAGLQSYHDGAAGYDYDVNSYLVGVRGKIGLGPAYINFGLHYGTNLGNYGILMRNEDGGSIYVTTTATDVETEDAKSFAGALVVGVKLSEMVTLEAGYGMMKNEVDVAGGTGKVEGDASSYYVQAALTVAPGFFIVPEISIYDLGETKQGGVTTDNGQVMFYGAKFQINF